MSLTQLLAAGFSTDLALDAIRLLHKLIATLEIAQDNGAEIICAITMTPETHDEICAFAAFDDREPEGLEEDDERDLPRLIEPTPPPAPAINVVAPAGARWLGPGGSARDPAPDLDAPSPAWPAELLIAGFAALIERRGLIPRSSTEWRGELAADEVRLLPTLAPPACVGRAYLIPA